MEEENNVGENLAVNSETNDDNFNSYNADTLKWSQLILFLLSFIGFLILFGIIIDLYGAFYNKDIIDKFTTSYPAIILEAVVFIIVFALFKSVRRFTLKAIDFSVLRSKKTYLYVALGFIFFMVTQYIFIYVLKVDNPMQQQDDLGLNQLSSTFDYIIYAFLIVLVVPIKEEILFRGIFHRFFETKYPRYGFWLGLIISSVIFGLLHFGVEVSAIVMGATFVILYWLTKSLVTSMLLHMTWNLLGIILIFFSM